MVHGWGMGGAWVHGHDGGGGLGGPRNIQNLSLKSPGSLKY